MNERHLQWACTSVQVRSSVFTLSLYILSTNNLIGSVPCPTSVFTLCLYILSTNSLIGSMPCPTLLSIHSEYTMVWCFLATRCPRRERTRGNKFSGILTYQPEELSLSCDANRLVTRLPEDEPTQNDVHDTQDQLRLRTRAAARRHTRRARRVGVTTVRRIL
jgi:hypothetical protein